MKGADDDVFPRGSRERVRVRFCEDDHEMSVIYDSYIRVQTLSKTRRGRVRRSAGSGYLRQLLVAGYKALYGAFPPMGEVPTGPMPAAAPAEAHPRIDTPQSGITTKVAYAAPAMNNQPARPASPAAEAPAKSAINFGTLLGGSASNLTDQT